MLKNSIGRAKYLAVIASMVIALTGCDHASEKSTEVRKLATVVINPIEVVGNETVSSKVIKKSAFEVGTRAVAWQFSHMDTIEEYIPMAKQYKKILDPKQWIQGAFFIGAARWSDTVADKDIVTAITKMAQEEHYALGHRPKHGDDHVVGQTYLWLYSKNGDKAAYKKIQPTFDAILADQPTNSLEFIPDPRLHFEGTCQDRWCWADALFMAPRVWMQLSNATGDPKYRDYADKEYWATVDYLFSNEYDLFFRDSRYFTKKSDNGEPVFWSRGNGWVYAALPLIIEEIPNGYPSKQRYLDLFIKMSKAMVKLQRPNGFWPSSLVDPDKVKTPETSGSAFITFGLAWGVNNGLLTDKTTIDAVEKGWAALASAVDDDGMLHWVQQIGAAPDPVTQSDTQLYGVGALLLAASEMSKWETPEKKVMAYGRFVPERDDDFTWENDKVAFRVYGPAGPKKGSFSGVDNWFKKVDYSIIDKWYAAHLKGISYHKNKGEGYDPYHVGDSRGTGGSAVWIKGKPYAANTFSSYKVLKSGADEVVFSLEYQWQTPLGLVAESKTISLALGEQLYQVNSVFSLDGKPAVLPIAIGITTHDEKAKISFNKARGRISAWETIDELGVGTGALVEPSIITDIQHLPSIEKDESHIWIFTYSDKQGKLSYRAGFSWEGAGEITDSPSWELYLDNLQTR